jgi:biopolymer transport protein ExbD
MRLRSMRNEDKPQLMIIPMIDIMFFLLIFFMMSTLYMVEQNTIAINLPIASAAQSDIPQSINITIMSDGKVVYEKEEIPLELLKRRVQLQMASQPESSFILRGDRQAEYGKVVAVMDELKQAGARRVAVATETKAR